MCGGQGHHLSFAYHCIVIAERVLYNWAWFVYPNSYSSDGFYQGDVVMIDAVLYFAK